MLGGGPGERTLATVSDVAVTDRRLIAAFAALLFFGLLAYELTAGFREGTRRSDGAA